MRATNAVGLTSLVTYHSVNTALTGVTPSAGDLRLGPAAGSLLSSATLDVGGFLSPSLASPPSPGAATPPPPLPRTAPIRALTAQTAPPPVRQHRRRRGPHAVRDGGRAPTSLSLADYADQIVAATDAALDSSPPPPSGGIEEGSSEEDVADSSGGGRGRRLSPAATFPAVITATACNVEGDCSSAASNKVIVDLEPPTGGAVADGLLLDQTSWYSVKLLSCDKKAGGCGATSLLKLAESAEVRSAKKSALAGVTLSEINTAVRPSRAPHARRKLVRLRRRPERHAKAELCAGSGCDARRHRPPQPHAHLCPPLAIRSPRSQAIDDVFRALGGGGRPRCSHRSIFRTAPSTITVRAHDLGNNHTVTSAGARHVPSAHALGRGEQHSDALLQPNCTQVVASWTPFADDGCDADAAHSWSRTTTAARPSRASSCRSATPRLTWPAGERHAAARGARRRNACGAGGNGGTVASPDVMRWCWRARCRARTTAATGHLS